MNGDATGSENGRGDYSSRSREVSLDGTELFVVWEPTNLDTYVAADPTVLTEVRP